MLFGCLDCELHPTPWLLLMTMGVQDKLYDQADLLVGKTTFPESTPNQEAARYQYYLGETALPVDG